jgi:hypothetical protein
MVTHTARDERLDNFRNRNKEIVELVEGGMTKAAVCRKFNLTSTRIAQIVRKETWLAERDEKLKEGYYYGQHSRFMIRRIHGWYYVHDASLVTDNDMKHGRGSPIIFRTKTEVRAIQWCHERDPYEFRSYDINVDHDDEAESD